VDAITCSFSGALGGFPIEWGQIVCFASLEAPGFVSGVRFAASAMPRMCTGSDDCESQQCLMQPLVLLGQDRGNWDLLAMRKHLQTSTVTDRVGDAVLAVTLPCGFTSSRGLSGWHRMRVGS
jgi:hypothetical protein